MAKPSTVLKKARKLIERGWTKDACARDKNGLPVAVDSKEACRWCMFGSLLAVARNDQGRMEAGAFLAEASNGSYIELNERAPNRRPVLAAFDRAIALAESEGK
jgi:hypothetical protein